MKRRERNKGPARAEAVQIRESGRHPFGVLDPVCAPGGGGAPALSGHPGGGAHPGRGHLEADPAGRRSGGEVRGARRPGGAGAVPPYCPHRAGTAGHPVLSGLLSGLHAHLRAGVGELVLDCQGREIAALLCAGPEQVEIREGDSPLDFQLCARGPGGTCEPLPWQELLLFTPFQPETEHPYGVSLLRSMPFLTDILLKIYQATGMNWERMGNVRFAVICRPGEGEGAYAQERCRQIAGEWSAAMQAGRQGAVRDFVAVGDLDIKVIGADNQVLDSQVPVRQILEQLVARTGIPPFLLGLSWSSTERMSAQQARSDDQRDHRPAPDPGAGGGAHL